MLNMNSEEYQSGDFDRFSKTGDVEILPALAPVAATHTGLKRTPVMNVQKID